MKNPAVSIIIAVYNVVPYIRSCLDSILAQTFTDWECILVDDGSTDGSGEICDEYAKAHHSLKVIHQNNAGVSSSRNRGMGHATGEYIVFIDSDDYVEPTYLETIWQNARGFDMMFFGDVYHFPDGSIHTHQPFYSESWDRPSVENRIIGLKHNREHYEYYGYTWNKVFRTAIITQHSIRFVEGLAMREDEIFTTEYCRHIKSLKVVPYPIYHYRVLNSGLTAKKKSVQTLELYCCELQKTRSAWITDQLSNLERYRYAMSLIRCYRSANRFSTKWRIGRKVWQEYRQRNNPYWVGTPFRMNTMLFLLYLLIKSFHIR